MKIYSVSDQAFVPYGKIIDGYDTAQFLEALRQNTEKPENKVIYVPSESALESQPLFSQLQNNIFGGLPIQAGYCNGSNKSLNALEYHRGSEVIIPDDDIILLLASLQKVKDGKLDTKEVEAFMVPAGKIVLLYETSLHYAPCCASGNSAFRASIVLPRDTNTKKPDMQPVTLEDKLLLAKNKWLIAHPDSNEAKNGLFAGLTGENITLT